MAVEGPTNELTLRRTVVVGGVPDAAWRWCREVRRVCRSAEVVAFVSHRIAETTKARRVKPRS